MDENRAIAKQFVEDAISLTQQLDDVTGKPYRPDRQLVIQQGQKVYQDLLRRRGSLVLTPMSEWAVDLLLDRVRTGLEILTETSEYSCCGAVSDDVSDRKTAHAWKAVS